MRGVKDFWRDKVDRILDDYAQGRITREVCEENLAKLGMREEEVEAIMDTI